MKLYFDSTVSAGVAIAPFRRYTNYLYILTDTCFAKWRPLRLPESSTQRNRDETIQISATPGPLFVADLVLYKERGTRVKAGVEAVNTAVQSEGRGVTLSEKAVGLLSLPAQTEGQQEGREKKETRPAREHIPGHQFVQLVLNNKETPHERYQALAPKNLSSAASSRRDRPSNGSSQNCATNPGSLPRVYGFAREDSDELMYKWRPAANVAVSSAHTLLQFEIEYECRKALRNGQREKYKPFNA
ncbi:Hypothetical_protein [Hexamita inflata]|uniref:Hypothetical_protein n=1 Tax=Hexamita inflata TaxID=28002 RepID=A0AA86V6X0_9EUKA|nr:Hypothetical protein HINF_LOCUS66242 [Hexamita inflata]